MSASFLRSLSKQADPAAAMTSPVSGRGECLLGNYFMYWLLILVQDSANLCKKSGPNAII